MSITISTVSGSLAATTIDANFDNVQKLLIEGIAKGDIDSNKLDKYVLKRYTDGKITSATVGSYPLYDGAQKTKKALADLIPDFVKARNNGSIAYESAIGRINNFSHQNPFEYLGSPGPSFYVDGQEEGTDLTTKTIIAETPSYADSANIDAIPAHLTKRFPENECWSRWLTVPHCSTKIWIPEACVALVNAQFAFYPGPGGTQYRIGHAGKKWQPHKVGKLQLTNACRVGLVVDTNPVVRAGVEFSNSNPNIIDPATGSQATHVSWRVFEEKAIRKVSTTINNVRGAVALQGGAWYNFSCKYRSAGTFGYLANHRWSNGSSSYVIDQFAESAGITSWNSAYLGSPPTDASAENVAKYSIGDFLWINTNMQIDLFYGRSVPEVDNISNNDLHSTPSHGY